MKLLAADIGGTNARFIYMDIAESKKNVLAEKSYLSGKYTDFTSLLNVFLAEHNIKEAIDAACFAVAGPVKSGEASVTNLPWVINERQLRAILKIPRVQLINDFIAVAYGVSTLSNTDVIILQQGQNNNDLQKNDAAVIGAGTGLGASHLVCKEGHYQAYASEAGHAGFSPQNALQNRLLNWLQEQQHYVCLEMLLSGGGLKKIYRFLSEVELLPESAAVKKAMQSTGPAQVITEYALKQNDELCQKALACFIDIYGAAAGDIVLHYYPLKELYIAGGIAAKISNKMADGRFIEAFVNKGLMSSNMKEITVKLVCDEKTGLYGALLCAQSLTESH
ncbi:Glucokinase [hydrothermal vent metagenome]|uniref:Glucokinase n=1 Tax=hydrothermal vent metagenome TaxID=652676 RepID=A0A3B0XBZ6_9ZZZZ